MRTISSTLVFLIATLGHAFAHWGHVGEVAGHAHWLGIGAVVVAGVIGAVLGKGAKDRGGEEAGEFAPDAEEGEAS